MAVFRALYKPRRGATNRENRRACGRRLLVAAVVAFCLVGTLPLWAQTDIFGTIDGRVRDATGGVCRERRWS